MTKRMVIAVLALGGIFVSVYLTLYKLGIHRSAELLDRFMRDRADEQMGDVPRPPGRRVGCASYYVACS